jgi:hypothetical protein
MLRIQRRKKRLCQNKYFPKGIHKNSQELNEFSLEKLERIKAIHHSDFKFCIEQFRLSVKLFRSKPHAAMVPWLECGLIL